MSIRARHSRVDRVTGIGLLPGRGEIPRAVAESSPRRVLISDREPLTRWSLAETLTEAGHLVVVAGDRMAILNAVTADPPFDVIVLDGDLPGSADFSLLSGLRLLSPSARIVFMTAFGTPAVHRRALDLGACHVIEKPFDLVDFLALVA